MCGIVMDRKYSYIMSLLTLAISIPVFSSLIYGKIYFSFGLVFNHLNAVVVCLIDIDDFKKINDKYGHLFGDECLKGVGKLLNSWSNYSYRYGGEEFICAFKLDSIENIDKILAELNSEVSCIRIKDVPNFRLTVSIGAYVFKPKNHESYDNCFEIMDENLYKVKKTGKNNYKYTIEDK